MNQQKQNICPICRSVISDGICSNCGYLQLIFPKVVPESIRIQEETRISTLQKFVRDNKQTLESARKEIDELKRNADILRHTVDAQKISIATADEESRQLKSENSKLQKDKDSLENELADSIACLKKARNSSETLSDQYRNLTSELNKVKYELQQSIRSQKAGNVFFILDDDGEFSVIPVPGKKHYFATGPGIESCHAPEDSILMLPVMTSAIVAFTVEKSLKGGYKLTDLAGTLISTGAMKENKMRLTQGVSLKFRGCNFKLYFCINQQ